MKEKRMNLSRKKLLENIAEEVKAARLAKNQSIEEFAENCKLSRRYLQAVEKAKTDTSPSILLNICHYLDIGLEELVKRAAQRSPYSRYNAGKIDTSALTEKEYIEYTRITVLRNIENCQMIFNEDLEELAKNSQTPVMSVYYSDPSLTSLVRIANYVKISLRDFFGYDRTFRGQEQKIDTDKVSRAIGEQVAAYRMGKKESERAFAGRCGIWLPRLKWIEMGRGTPNLTTLIKLAYHMEIAPAEFFGGAEDRAAQYTAAKTVQKSQAGGKKPV